MKNLNEELNRMSYLFGYKKGVVISEQETVPVTPNQTDKPKEGPKFNIPIFGPVDFSKLQTLTPGEQSNIEKFIDVNADEEGFTFVIQEGFRGKCNGLMVENGNLLAAGFSNNKILYKNILNTYPYKFFESELNEETPIVFPIVFRVGGNSKYQYRIHELQFKFIKRKENKNLKKSIYRLEINVPEKMIEFDNKLNQVPGGQIVVTMSQKTSKKGNFDTTAQKKVIINLDLQDPFKFNSTEFVGNTLEKINSEFVDKFRRLKENHPQDYSRLINILKQYDKISVYGYSSIDGDPSEVIDYKEGVNSVEGCGGRKTRKEYDLCLSQKRADKVAEILNNSIPDIRGKFVGKGLGQTEKHAVGMKFPNVKDPSKTAPNRRFVVDGIPQVNITTTF